MQKLHETTEARPDRIKEDENNLVFSYLTLRNLIGISGILLPFILYFTTGRGENDRVIEHSISDYYYSSNGDVLVVLLSVLGVFLFTYYGYNWRENILTTLAAICGIGIGFSPTATQSANSLTIHIPRNTVPEIFGIERHFIFAATFFICLAIMSLKYFPMTDKKSLETADGRKTQKAKRNIVFKICGWVIIACVVILGIYFISKPISFSGDFPVVFVFETIAVWAFGVSWITKGETLWPDGEHYITKAFRIVKFNALK